MDKAVARANNDVAFIAWHYDQKIADCLGFAIHRTDLKTKKTETIPSWVGFSGQADGKWSAQTTEVWPIQKFCWRDLTATRGGSYSYEVVPMVGKPGSLKPLQDHSLKTNSISLVPTLGDISAYFNRGILSTQALAHRLPEGKDGSPSFESLEEHIKTPGDAMRNRLAGQMIEALSSLLKRAEAEGGECYCALYELDDPELLGLILGSKSVHLILSNTGPDDATDKDSRQKLHDSGIDITDRMLTGDHIGHNKFMVYVDKNKKPQTVLTGSTNWTPTALCGQSNNCLIINSPDVAASYLEYWNRIKEDDSAQGADLRTADQEVCSADVDGGKLDVWFSPNTHQHSKPSKNPPEPVDMKAVFDVIDNAKSGIVFLVFQPGTPSVMDTVLAREEANSDLFVRGAATDAKAVENYDVQLFHHAGSKPDVVNDVVAASAVKDQFAYWHKELLKSSPSAHAIIHDKIVVVDPFSPDCVVVTGSHNLGYKASYANDENLVIIRGNQPLACAYAVHVMDVYDHYRWRFTLQKNGEQAWTGLAQDDSWQDKYFKTKQIQGEVKFWVS